MKTEKLKEQRLKKGKTKSQNIQGLWDNYKRCNIHIMELSKGEEREKETEEICETIMTENFPKLKSDHKRRKLREHEAG